MTNTCDFYECRHIYVNYAGVCSECGIVIQSVYNNESNLFFNTQSSYTSITDKGILPDMDIIDVSDEVKMIANSIFKRLKLPTHRGKRRKLLVFFCIFNAFAELDTPKDPRHLATLVGISPNEVSKAFSLYNEVQTGYKTQIQKMTPLSLIPEYCSRLEGDLNVGIIIDLAERILEKSHKLREKYPQKVAAGIIQYYMNIYGIKYNKKKFAEVIGLSEATISNMYREISMIDNS
jgi:transcription initiation factor TFIIIB Brf1 subunit/transcription initiation factor TFIIB